MAPEKSGITCKVKAMFKSRRQFLSAGAVFIASSGSMPSLTARGDGGGLNGGSNGGSSSGGSSGGGSTRGSASPVYLMPSEDTPHSRTFMAFASSAEGIWGPVTPQSTNAGIVRVQQDLIDIAKAIGTYEPVTMLVQPSDVVTADSLLANPSSANPQIHANYAARTANTGGVTLVSSSNFNDFWMRDTGCLFVKDTANSNALVAIGFNFNGWGNGNTDGAANASLGITPTIVAASNRSKAQKWFQPYNNDHTVAGWMASEKAVPLVASSLTLEGGAIEIDGEGTAIISESSLLHVNRNPQLYSAPNRNIAQATLLSSAKATVLAELQRTLGVQKILWIPGTAIFPPTSGVGFTPGAAAPEAETDITNGHTDFYARFLAPGVVAYATDTSNSTGEKAIMAANLTKLQEQTDAKERSLSLVPMNAPATYGTSAGVTLNSAQLSNFAAGYINFYPCNGAVILPKFNDEQADAAAVAAITPYANGRAIIQVDILGVASGGGGIHCTTQQLPA